MKRIVTMLLAAALVFSMVVFPASAADGFYAEILINGSAETTEVNQGDLVTVTVDVKNNPGIRFLRFKLYYNAEVFEYVSHVSHDLLGSPTISDIGGYVSYLTNLGKGNAISKTGELYTVTFRAKTVYDNAQFYAELVDNHSANCKGNDGNVSFSVLSKSVSVVPSNVHIYESDTLIGSYGTLTKALENYGADQHIKLSGNITEDLSLDKEVYLDLNGYTWNGNVTGTGKLYLVDSATDDFDGAYGNLTGSVDVAVESFVTFGGKTYLVVNEDGAYSAHRYDVQLTHVSLDASNDALGYKAKFNGDEVVRNHVTGYGFNLWLDGNQPNAYKKDGTFTNDQVLTLRLKNIMAAGGGEANINGDAFVIFDVDGEQKTCEDHSTSMKQTIQAVDSAWETFTTEQQTAVKNLCNQYLDAVADWNLDNIFPTIDIPIEDVSGE